MFKRIHITAISFLFMASITLVACSKDEAPTPAPLIASFYPGTASTGEPVKITGQNFTGATSVNFGGAAAQSFTIISDSVIMAYVASGNSGNITVTGPNGNISASGFVYYTPDVFNLAGTSLYEVTPLTYTTPLLSLSKTDSATVKILKNNKNDFERNQHSLGVGPISPYADSADYVRICGAVIEADPFTSGSPFGSFKNTSNSVVYAKQVNGLITIPSQLVYWYGGGSYLSYSGSGSNTGGKLTLNYRTQYKGSVKTSTLVSY